MITVLATGGTITNTPAGRLDAVEAIGQVPEAEAISRIRVQEMNRVASSSLGFADMIEVSQAVNDTLRDDPHVDGVVVTVGSNQSEDLAYYLNLTVSSVKPVVVTAAQRQRTTPSEDATRNLIDAVATASAPDAGGKGVMLVANELIHPAREVTKNVVSRVDSWESPDTGAIGIVSGGRAVFYRSPVRRHTLESEFVDDQPSSASDLPKAEIVYSYADADPEMIEWLVHKGTRGIVVAAFATGAAHSEQEKALTNAALEKGVAVAISNRGSSGRIAPDGRPFVAADNLRPQKALVLLKLALRRTQERSELQRYFNEY